MNVVCTPHIMSRSSLRRSGWRSSAGRSCSANHEILSSETFPAAASLCRKTASSFDLRTSVKVCFRPYTVGSQSSQNPKMCFRGILKENVFLTVGCLMRYDCLVLYPPLSAMTAVDVVSYCHNWLRP